MLAFTDQIVVITGASDGSGAGLARQLSAEKPRPADWNPRGARALALATDVTDEARCRALVDRVVDAYGRAKAGLWLRLVAPQLVDRLALAALHKTHGGRR